jgi:(S)-2-hydroxy-acid oxidase
MTVSLWANSSFLGIANAAPFGLKWFTLEFAKNEKFAKDVIRKAENTGFKGIVLTCDSPTIGKLFEIQRSKFALSSHLSTPNMEMLGSVRGLSFADSFKIWGNRPVTWKDVKWLKSYTKLPIILKGILTGEDAKLAVEYGADAILVSNHGGRRLDGVPATVRTSFFLCLALSYVLNNLLLKTSVIKSYT